MAIIFSIDLGTNSIGYAKRDTDCNGKLENRVRGVIPGKQSY